MLVKKQMTHQEMALKSNLKISVTIITLNEESNLPRALKSVIGDELLDEIIVVDSGSTDKTVEIAKSFGAKVVFNPWPGYGKQKNFAQTLAKNDWILSLDADEEITPGLKKEIQQVIDKIHEDQSLKDPLFTRGFALPRKTFFMGQWIKHGGWYPNCKVRLADRRFSSWTEPNVHEELVVNGNVQFLKSPILHYSFSNIQSQILTNLRFANLGSLELHRTGKRASKIRLVLKPIWKFVETFLLKKGFLDGLPGFIISMNAAHSVFLKHAFLIEAQKQHENSDR